MLNKLFIELTKSRARHSNDNALAESKNGAIVRKHLGYTHIPQRYAPLINCFLSEYLNPYINFHRPCFFPEIVKDYRGKEIKKYPYERMMTPYDKLRSLPNSKQYLKSNFSFKQLDEIAKLMSDNESARTMNEARNRLFTKINEQEKTVLRKAASR